MPAANIRAATIPGPGGYGDPWLVQEPDAHRFDGGLSAVRDSELAEDALDILLRGRHAPAHAVGDLAIGQALRDQTQNIAIDRGQLVGRPRTSPRLDRDLGHEAAQKLGVEDGLAVAHGPYRGQELAPAHPLEDVTPCTRQNGR